MPMIAAGTSTIAITQPVSSATRRPATAPPMASIRVRGVSRVNQPPARPNRVTVRVGRGGLGGVGISA